MSCDILCPRPEGLVLTQVLTSSDNETGKCSGAGVGAAPVHQERGPKMCVLALAVTLWTHTVFWLLVF